jgi:sigma-70-like protein
MSPGGRFTNAARELEWRPAGAMSARVLPLRGTAGWVEPAGQPNAAGMSAVGVSYALRGEGRNGHGSAGRTQIAGEPAVVGPAVDITTLFRRHYAELVRLAVMLVGDRPTAEDVVQDVFVRPHTSRDRPGPSGDQLAYVRACVLNGCRSLVFVSLWCAYGPAGSQYCTQATAYGQVRTLRLTLGGGLLSQGSVLLADSRRYPDIIQARTGPRGKSLTVVVLSARTVGLVNPEPLELRVIQIPLAGGRLADRRLGGGRPRLLYRGAVDGNPNVFLGSAASGRYLLLAGARNGWIDHGRLRLLPPQGGGAFADTW